MNRIKLAAVATCLSLASLGVFPAMADTWNKKTIITINEAVQVPGAVLQPGKYVMKLMDSQADRHIVQIFNEREDQLQTTVLAIPNYRMQPTGKTEFQWWETPQGQPKAMRAWFYPGDNFGQEFAYPKSEAVAIATATNSTVPTTAATTETELTTARVSTVDKSGTEKELDRQTYQQPKTEVAANQTTPRTTTPADNQTTQLAQNTMPAVTPADNGTTRTRTLPR